MAFSNKLYLSGRVIIYYYKITEYLFTCSTHVLHIFTKKKISRGESNINGAMQRFRAQERIEKKKLVKVYINDLYICLLYNFQNIDYLINTNYS